VKLAARLLAWCAWPFLGCAWLLTRADAAVSEPSLGIDYRARGVNLRLLPMTEADVRMLLPRWYGRAMLDAACLDDVRWAVSWGPFEIAGVR